VGSDTVEDAAVVMGVMEVVVVVAAWFWAAESGSDLTALVDIPQGH
jgi:hypothetical protein